VCRVQGLVVQRGPNGHRARVRREAGLPVAKERENTLRQLIIVKATACSSTSRARRWARVEGPFGKAAGPGNSCARFDGLIMEEHVCAPLLGVMGCQL